MPAPIRDKTAVPPLPPLPRHLVRLHKALAWWCNVVVTDPLGRLRWIYRYMNIYNRFISTLAVCRRGCSACCHIDVDLTETEAVLIARHTGRDYTKRAIHTHGHTSPCPFLGAQGECTIYSVRPFNCRTFHALDDPKYCATGEDHAVYGLPSFDYTSKILFSLAQAIDHIDGHRPRRDIRDFFS
ncbi:hypothetical protein GCM10023307_35710 [Lysobacter hankyongensis]|uniref:YkgJ family cysteine cluster protein n=2 Tax=Lysobacter hankyongensis TaxID=1176535 RepID=A0ABP9C7H9_9GAMM